MKQAYDEFWWTVWIMPSVALGVAVFAELGFDLSPAQRSHYWGLVKSGLVIALPVSVERLWRKQHRQASNGDKK